MARPNTQNRFVIGFYFTRHYVVFRNAALASRIKRAIFTPDAREMLSPCGACRQVMYEKETQGNVPMEVILYGSKKIQIINRMTDLLPLPFRLDNLT